MEMIKSFIIGVLVIVLILLLMFIYSCIRISSEVENDNKPSQDRKTKINK